MKILVTGGAGYIGSFMVRRLLEDGNQVFVIDNLSRGQKDVIDSRARFIEGNISDKELLRKVFQNQIDAVIHFAGYISMGESMEKPGLYFENNTTNALKLLEVMSDSNVSKIIFSSTAGVYGNPESIPIPENHPTNPTNPYGQSKLMVEEILAWYQKIFGISFAALRYFNASGAALDGKYGEDHDPETHIIPKAISSILNESEFNLFGTDYDTKDGTCIRDYIHIIDLVEAHVLALKKIQGENGGYSYNVGTGNGFSNREVVDMIEEVSGKKINVKEASRRPGDANILIADPKKINDELNFSPQHSDIRTIVDSAWRWHENNPKFKVQRPK